MKPGQTVSLYPANPEEKAILDNAEATIAPFVKKLNDQRTRVNGTSGVAQGYPLPGIAEDIRAFIKRLKI